jgi:RNA polymerase sigma-70 factor (ECF subfamily)
MTKAERPPLALSSPAARARPSLEQLYAEHFDFVWRSVRRLGVAPSALDDAVQDVFLVVHRRIADYEPRHSPRAWLFAIARRVASDHRRSVQRKGGLSQLRDSMPAPPAAGPHEGAMRNQAARIVHEFLDTLDEDRRAVFALAELEQMNAREIAEALDANQSTVYSRLASARKALLAFLEARYPEAMGGHDG